MHPAISATRRFNVALFEVTKELRCAIPLREEKIATSPSTNVSVFINVPSRSTQIGRFFSRQFPGRSNLRLPLVIGACIEQAVFGIARKIFLQM